LAQRRWGWISLSILLSNL